jgi:hypothetical protein
MPRSYVSPGTVQRLTTTIIPRVFTTQKALSNGGITVQFARYSPVQQDYIAIPPQTVVLTYANREEQGSLGDAARITTVGGSMTFLSPMDVQPGDIFTLAGVDGYISGEIIAVGPVKLGRQKATWTLRVGGI